MSPTATQAAIQTKATLHTVAALQTNSPITQTPCHQLPPKPQYPQQKPGKVIPKQDWPKWNDHVQCLPPIQSTVLPLLPAMNKATLFTLHPCILHCQMMQSLWYQLMLTQTLIDCLSSMILLDATSNLSRTTSKNLFDLITNLPPMYPMALLTNLSCTPVYEK